MPPTASVTCRMPTRRSHRSVSWSSRVSSVRIASTGTSQSTSSSTVPSRSAARRVQFSNGVVVKYVDGRIRRRSSQTCTTTYVSVISSIRPHSSATTTTSSTRIASVNASCSPANTLARELCAARPATIEMRPADARRLAPSARADGNVSRIAAIAQSTRIATVMRRSTWTWVRTRRACRLSATSIRYRCRAASSSTKARLPIEPRHGDDERDQQDVLDGPRPVGRVGAQAQRDPDRDHEQDRAHGLARAAGQVGGDGRAAREASHHHGEEGRGEEGDDDGGEERQRRDDEALDTVGHGRLDSAGQEVGAHVPQRRQCRT